MRRLFLAFLLASACFAEKIDNPQLVTLIEGVVVEEGVVRALSGEITELRLNLSVPQQSARQDAFYSGATQRDDEGNSVATIFVPNPPNPFPYSIQTRITARSHQTTFLPLNYSVPSELLAYARPTPRIQSDDPRIQRLAREITAGSRDDFERVARLAVFTHDYLKYDASLAGEVKDALWALDNKRGVCVEYSALFAALARSLGFPTRSVAGYAVSEDGEWLGHAWNEVFLGEWVPVDATWLEVGSLDATHIEMLRANDKTFGNNLSVLMRPGTRIDWSNRNMLGSEVQAVRPTRVELAQPESSFDLELASPVLQPGGETIAWLEFPASDYRVVEASLEPCKGPSVIASVEDRERALITRPGEKVAVAWRVRASPSLSSSFIYTCPLLLNSPFLEERPVELRIEPGAPSASLEAWLSSNQLLPGGEQTVFFKVKGGSPSKIGVAAGEGVFFSQAPSPGLTGSLSYSPRGLGFQKIFVFTDQGGVVELNFNITHSLALFLQNASFPTSLLEGSLASVNVSLFLNRSVPGSVRLSLSLDNESDFETAVFNGSANLSLSAPATVPGARELILVIEGDGTRIEQRQAVRVVAKPAVGVRGVSPPSGNSTVFITLSFVGEPTNVTISSDGQAVRLRQGEWAAPLRMFPGMRNITITWRDEFGNFYQKTEEVWVPSTPLPCLPALIAGFASALLCLHGFFKRAH
ncbi:MAG: transglutaminase-like domain-containing protein [Candidatus Micrarchaeia archaeon]